MDSTTLQTLRALHIWHVTADTHHSAVQTRRNHAVNLETVLQYGLPQLKQHTHLHAQCCYITIYLNHLNATTVPFCFHQPITGCFPKIKQLINDNTLVIVGVALGIAALEVRLWLSSSAFHVSI